MPKLPAKAALALALAIVPAGCTSAPAAPPAVRASQTFVVPTALSNGRVEITIAPSYRRGSILTIPVTIVTTRGTISGPVTARVLASGINEGGRPAEVLVRELSTAPITVGAGSRGSTTLSWDTRDLKGEVVPADAYSLVLELRSQDGAAPATVTASATLELR